MTRPQPTTTLLSVGAATSDSEVLLRFSRIAALADRADHVLQALVRTAVEDLGASAAAILRVGASGDVTVGESEGLPPLQPDFRDEAETIDAELGDRLLAWAGDGYARASTLPLVSDAKLFGALVMLHGPSDELSEETKQVATALTDLAALAMDRAFQYDELRRSYAELRASREVLAHAHKLRALGQMAAGVSHDIKNILNPLSLHLQLLERIVPKNLVDAQEAIAEMRQVIRRGVQTVERLRDFSRQAPESRLERAQLDDLVSEAVEISKPRLATLEHAHLSLSKELGHPPEVFVQSSELVAALVNLIGNAVDAMAAQGKRVVVSTGCREGRAWVCVRDDGPGMTPEIERRAFEPFFTTKGQEGTGLGLANVYAFAKRHGATLDLKTELGKGAAFTIAFPLAQGT